MTGLDLEAFLELLKAELLAWTTLGVALGLLALMTWTSWGSRKALRKCLVLSIGAHVGLVVYGSTQPELLSLLPSPLSTSESSPGRERRLRVDTAASVASQAPGDLSVADSRIGGNGAARWDVLPESGSLPGFSSPITRRRDASGLTEPELSRPESAPLATQTKVTELSPSISSISPPNLAESTTEPALPLPAAIEEGPVIPNPRATTSARSGDPAVIANRRLRPDQNSIRPSNPTLAAASSGPTPTIERSAPDLSNKDLGPPTSAPGMADLKAPPSLLQPPPTSDRGGIVPTPDNSAPLASIATRPMTRREVVPETETRRRARPAETLAPPASARDLAALSPNNDLGTLRLPSVQPSIGSPASSNVTGGAGSLPPLREIPTVYRSRLDPNRSAMAARDGANAASEEAVERALEWLSRHQDADGRWDGGTARYKDGSVAENDDEFTIHCPPGDVCFGPCYYWEGDTALTGLALLAYLGSGYTHKEGKYENTVAKGLDFLRSQQKPDGDLRGRSVAVGMYCHAIATLTLCEAYALTRDPRLRVSVERAVAFLVRSRATDRLAWRYSPGAPIGDTSILGWVVMALKSAKEVGIAIDPGVRSGISVWLDRVSSGTHSGLAKYQPGEKVTPTMTAEAWVCRQFLELTSSSERNKESADYLLQNAPSKGQFNLYYWYYGTLSMYQHGGESWNKWNTEMRDGILRRQRTTGHATGSWDPDESQYGTHGGRIYCTALATLSLEVYYRYLRLYDARNGFPSSP